MMEEEDLVAVSNTLNPISFSSTKNDNSDIKKQ